MNLDAIALELTKALEAKQLVSLHSTRFGAILRINSNEYKFSTGKAAMAFFSAYGISTTDIEFIF